jgi:uncharacterized repeat protein (TIGR01451 family)
MKFYNRKILLGIFLLLVFVTSVNANFHITASEYGSVLNYYDEYFIVNIMGNFTMENNYDIPLYGIKLPLNPSTLSIVDESGQNIIRDQSIRLPLIEASSSVTFPYHIFGIATEDPFEGLYVTGEAALRDMIENVSITAYSDMIISLKKAELGRLVSNRPLEVRITNPTGLEYIINNIRIIKTPDGDVNNEIYHIDIPEKSVLYANEEWVYSLVDPNTGLKEEDVYWFYADMRPQNFNITYEDNIGVDVLDEGDLEKYPQEGTAVPDVDQVIPASPLIPKTRVFLRKTVDPTRVYPGDVMNITLIVTNLESQAKIITLKDIIPQGFELVDTSKEAIQTGRDMQWIVEVNRDTSKLISYSLRFIENNTVGLHYLPPAEAYYDDKTVYSPSVPIIKKFVPKKKIYLQKSIAHTTFDKIKITIVLRNMGEIEMPDLILKEYLEPDSEFSEINKQPTSKGVWEIDILDKNEDWVVTYKTNNHRFVDNLPSLYGIDDMYVMKTLIKENIVSQFAFIPGMNFIEMIGILVVILFPIAFIYLFVQKRKLGEMGG